MKTPNRNETINTHMKIISPLYLLLLAAMVGWETSATAQEANAKPATAAAPPADARAATNPPPPTALSAGVSEILKLAEAKVSTEVIKTYVECSPTAYQLTEADVIALKQQQVADDIVNLLLRRSAEARAAVAQARQEAVAGVLAARRRATGGFDPESYEYFQYYHLQPRALASAYQRLSPRYHPALPYAYGYPPALAFAPCFSSQPAPPRPPGSPRGWSR